MCSKLTESRFPGELPVEIGGASAWYGPEMATRADWVYDLDQREISEIEKAMSPLVKQDVNIAKITKDIFPLPTLGPRLEKIRAEVVTGRGFSLMRGLPVGKWSLREAATAYFGIGTYFGKFLSQNSKGHILGHVRDLGRDAVNDPTARVYQTTERQTFHADRCDIVGLLCLQTAKSGGASSVVSSMTIYNEMRKRDPQLLQVLFRPFPMDRRGEVGPGQRPYSMTPVYSWKDGLLSAYYVGRYIRSAKRFPDAPPLTDDQIAAMRMFEELSNDPSLHMHMDFRPGDMQWVYNHTMLHDRTAYEDWPDDERKRHLLRLWVAVPDDRQLAECYRDRWGSITVGNRGGVVPDNELVAPLEAE